MDRRRRGPGRLMGRLATGPSGHLYSLVADLSEAWARYALERTARRLSRGLPRLGGRRRGATEG